MQATASENFLWISTSYCDQVARAIALRCTACSISGAMPVDACDGDTFDTGSSICGSVFIITGADGADGGAGPDCGVVVGAAACAAATCDGCTPAGTVVDALSFGFTIGAMVELAVTVSLVA